MWLQGQGVCVRLVADMVKHPPNIIFLQKYVIRTWVRIWMAIFLYHHHAAVLLNSARPYLFTWVLRFIKVQCMTQICIESWGHVKMVWRWILKYYFLTMCTRIQALILWLKLRFDLFPFPLIMEYISVTWTVRIVVPRTTTDKTFCCAMVTPLQP